MSSILTVLIVFLFLFIVIGTLTNIGTAAIVISSVLVLRYLHLMIREPCIAETDPESFAGGIIEGAEGSPAADKKAAKKGAKQKKPKKKIPMTNKMKLETASAVADVLYPPYHTADDKIFNASIHSGLKAKKSKDIRSHWNNHNWKKYFDYELEMHSDSNREWWSNDEHELAKKHVVL